MSSETPSSPSLTLYDIKTAPPVVDTCCAPNPWKARFALNFKAAPYETSWTDLPDISKVRQSLQVPAGRKWADGTDYFTLPVLQDHETGALVGDSFDIAVYLQKKYPESGAGNLFPPLDLDFTYEREMLVPLSKIHNDDYPEYVKFNINVDTFFTTHVALTTERYPFDPATFDACKAEWVRRASPWGITSWEQFTMSAEAREKTLQSMADGSKDLAQLFARNGGPFLQGSHACYADLIVGAWLQMFARSMPEKEWQDIKQWHGAAFGRLYDALQVYTRVV